MNNQYDHLDLDVYNLFLDESDVGARVELEERLRQSKSTLCTGRRTKLKKKKNGWMLCDERYIFEDNDVEILFEITNEHIAAVLRPNSLSRLSNKLCGFNWKHLSCLCAVLFGVLLGLIFLNLPSLLAINYIRSLSMRKQRNCRVLRPLLGCTVGTKQRSFSYLKEICQF